MTGVFDNRYSYPVELVVACFLLFLAWVVWRYSSDRVARRPLALFLCLVGLNHALIGIAHSTSLVAEAAGATSLVDRGTILWFYHVADFLQVFDAPVLVVAVVALVRRSIPAWLVGAAIGLAAAFVALFFTLMPPGASDNFSILNAPLRICIAAAYLATFVLLAASFAREARPLQQERLAGFVVAFGAVLPTRIPLMLTESGILAVGDLATPALLALTLFGLVAACLLVAWALAPNCPVSALTSVSRRLALVLGAVAAVWLLQAEPTLGGVSFSLWYISRWIIFAIVLAAGIHRLGLLEVGERAEHRLWAALGAVAFLTTASILWSFLAGSRATGAAAGLVASLAISALMLGMSVALVRAHPGQGTLLEWRRLALYRAHLELGTDAHELARLRKRLGIAAEQATRLAELVHEEKRTRAAPAQALAPGVLFAGRYEVQDVLGVGGFGRALQAFDRARGTTVVLKEILEAWRGDPQASARLREEARILLKVAHPNLVAFHDIERVPGGHVLVLQHVEGPSLRQRLAEGPLGIREARRLATGLLRGLGQLHALGIAHGDVKPENVILERGREPVLLDFGAARILGHRTKAEPRAGTDAYMSPERRAGGEPTPADDLYAAGVLLWEALTGVLPPNGKVPTRLQPALLQALGPVPVRWADAEAMSDALNA